MALLLFSGAALGREPSIRVRIFKSLEKVVVSGIDLTRNVHRSGDIRVHPGQKAILFNCSEAKKIGKRQQPILLASVSSPGGFVTVNRERYRGSLFLTTSSEGGGGCDVINKTVMEYYIGGLLAKEMNASWPLEALKSQAVAARTYALHMMRSRRVERKKGFPVHYDIESSERHQVGGSWDDITRRTDRAARETAGYVLKGPDLRLTPAFYHAKCGGQTRTPEHVWGNPVAGYSSVICGGCEGRGGKSRWKKRIPRQRWNRFLHWLRRKNFLRGEKEILGRGMQMAPDKISRHSLRVYMGEEVFFIKKSLLRRYFGRVTVPSNHFRAWWDSKRRVVILSGDGLGHGVGLCQVGTLGWANRGKNFAQILSHYFPAHQLRKVY